MIAKIGAAGLVAAGSGVLLLSGLAVAGAIGWSGAPLWLPALLLAGGAFAGFGVLLGAVLRDARAASLAAILLAVPVAVVALIPAQRVGKAWRSCWMPRRPSSRSQRPGSSSMPPSRSSGRLGTPPSSPRSSGRTPSLPPCSCAAPAARSARSARGAVVAPRRACDPSAMRFLLPAALLLSLAAAPAADAATRLRTATSCEMVLKAGRAAAVRAPIPFRGGSIWGTGQLTPRAALTAPGPRLEPGTLVETVAETAGDAAPTADASTTNVQEVGIDEPDVMKVVGTTVYASSEPISALWT